jgi:hypothetical protein
MADGSKRSAPEVEVEGPNKAPRTSLQASPANMPPLNDPVDKEIYVLQLRERILQQETAKLEAEERVLKARTQLATRPTEAADEEDFFNEEIPGEMSASLDTIRSYFGAVPDKYLKQIYHDKFDPKNIVRLSPPLGTIQDRDDEAKFDITTTTIRIRKPSATLKEYGSSTVHWSRAFNVYGAILSSFFALKNPSLPSAIFHFGWQIETLAESFSWQEACLPLAIAALDRVRTQGRLDPKSWNIPQPLVANYCRWDRLRDSREAPRAARPRSQSGQTNQPPVGLGSTNNNETICQKYRELGFCPRPGVCRRRHIREDNSQANKRTA